MKLYLASTSPRRRDLLSRLNIPFEIIAPTFEEKSTLLSPSEEARYFAEQKVRSIANQCPNALIIGSDTLIDFGGKKLGKPKDAQDAYTMLQSLAGKTHHVLTALVLYNTSTQEMKTHIDKASVTFKMITPEQIKDYIETGEPMDKAGAYAIQGLGHTLIEGFDGDLETIIGLPLRQLSVWLKDEKIK